MHADLWPVADAFTDSTVYALALRRWLAAHLGCEPTREAVTAAREAAIQADAVAYTKGLMDAAGVVAVLSDEGYPQPPIPADEFAATIGVTVHRVTRLEPWILQHRDGTFDELVSGVEDEAERAAARPELRRVQVDRRLPDRARHRRSRRVGRPGRVRAMAGRRLGRDEGARQAGPRLPDPPDARRREGERPAVPLPLRRRRPGHQPGARGPGVDVPLPRRRPGPTDRPRALGVSRGSARPRTSLRSSRTSTSSSPS